MKVSHLAFLFWEIMEFLILALATFRIVHLTVHEDGPLNILAKLRQWAGVRQDEHGSQYGVNNFATGLICLYCNSIWTGAALALAHYLWPEIVLLAALPLALSAAVVLLDRYLG